jgi:hypothetical protein
VYKENIQHQLGFGRKKMDRIWSEAKTAGYLKVTKYRQTNGTWNYTYTISDVPLSTVPLSNVGSSIVGKRDTIKSNRIKKNIIKNKDNSNNLELTTKQSEVLNFKGIMTESQFNTIWNEKE